MAKQKVRVLYPAAFLAAGIEVYERKTDKSGRVTSEAQLETVELDDAFASQLIAAGHAEPVKKS